MSDIVLRYLREAAPESKARLTTYFASEVEEASILIGKIVATLQNYHRLDQQHDENSATEVAFGLMTKGANTLMAALELSLNGYLWEPSILLCSALEEFSTAWDIVHNSARFELWRRGKKFDSTDSVANAATAIEPLGSLYGHLSKSSGRTNTLNRSPSMVVDEGQAKLQLFGLITRGKEAIRKTEIYLSLFVAYICLQLTELVFYQYASPLETIEQIPDTDMARPTVSERHRKFSKEMQTLFSQIVRDASVRF